jgi:hypothetical protein
MLHELNIFWVKRALGLGTNKDIFWGWAAGITLFTFVIIFFYSRALQNYQNTPVRYLSSGFYVQNL